MSPTVRTLNDPPKPSEQLTDLFFKRRNNPNQSAIYVEGPDDASALAPHIDATCKVVDLKGKQKVRDIINKAAHFPNCERIGLDGVIGLVDRDFELVSQATGSANHVRVQFLPDLNDLESVVLFHQGTLILKRLVKDVQALSLQSWISGEHPYQNLVEKIVAPLGALRVSWIDCFQGQFGPIEPSENYDEFTKDNSLVVRAFKIARPECRLATDDLLKLLPRDNKNFKPRLDEIASRIDPLIKQHSLDEGGNPWALVRGKDLTRCIASLLMSNNAVLLHQYLDSIGRIENDLGIAIRMSYDRDVIRKTSLAVCIERATTTDPPGKFKYLK